jgi:aryl-alcohol dehydrogenase-like predicted oxidoreductase
MGFSIKQWNGHKRHYNLFLLCSQCIFVKQTQGIDSSPRAKQVPNSANRSKTMKYNQLGQTDIKVSELCLGSMTWGTQNTSAQAADQIDLALERGVNIIDCAEMYPVTPLSKETQGDSERCIGDWVKASGRRDKVMIATKIAGAGYKNVRNGAPISPKNMFAAVEGSLERLKTDYIDLYQLHWPNRGSYMFRQNWNYDPTSQNKAETLDHMAEILEAMATLQKMGKIRHFGLSNESAWGTTQWVNTAERTNTPRVVSIQNEYSLLCRLFDTDLAETCHNEDIGLLSYSPLATGLLTGKYQNGAVPAGTRNTIAGNLHGRETPRVWAAIDAYLAVAEKHNVDPVHMSLAWCCTRPFMASAIFGSTTLEQLDRALGSTDITLSDECMRDISATHREHPLPY